MTAFDLVALWIGRSVFIAAALIGAALFAAGVNFLAGLAFWSYARKIGFSARNWGDVSRWTRAGRPDWKQGKDGIFRMVPSAAKYEDKSK